MLSARGIEAEKLLLEGALPQDVDARSPSSASDGPVRDGPISPARCRLALAQGARVRNEIADSLAEQGRFGQKDRQGLLSLRRPLGASRRRSEADRRASVRLGVKRRNVSKEEIIERTDPPDGERRRAASSKRASRPAPRHRRGLALCYGFPAGARADHWADTVGLKKIRDRLRELAKEPASSAMSPRFAQQAADEGGNIRQHRRRQGA